MKECEEEEEEQQLRNYSATNNFNSTNFIRRRRAKIRAAARKAIQPLLMSVKCLHRELEMKKVEEEIIDNTNRFYYS